MRTRAEMIKRIKKTAGIVFMATVISLFAVVCTPVNTEAETKDSEKKTVSEDKAEKTNSNSNTDNNTDAKKGNKKANTTSIPTDVPLAKLYKKGTYHVSQDGTGDFSSLASAVVTVPSGSTLIVHEGLYNEALTIHGKVINMRGVSKENCVIQFDTSNYAKVPLNISAGRYENLTINGYHNLKQTAPFAGYAIHIDNDTLAGQEVTFSNCNIVSENAFCVGIGLRRGARITFRGCNFTSRKQGVMLFHDSQTPSLAGTASITIDNCYMNNSAEGLIIAQCLSPASVTNITFRNNTVVGNGDGHCLAYGSYGGEGNGWVGAQNVVLTKNSAGNNIMSFNYADMAQYNAMMAQKGQQLAVANNSFQKSKSGKYYTIRTEDGIETNIPVENLDEFSPESYGITTPAEQPAPVSDTSAGSTQSETVQYHTIRTEDGIEINVAGAPN